MYKLKIKEYRKSKGLTQKQLASRIGISQNFLSEIENGKYNITLSLLFEIGRALNLCPHRLVEYSCSIDCSSYCK